MDTDPNAYFDRGQSSSSSSTSAFPQQRPSTAGHRPNASQDTDPRAAAHSSPKLGSGGPMLATQRAPPSPKLAPSPTLAPPTPHAESSQAAARRNAAAAVAAAAAVTGSGAVTPLESDMFTPFVSPAPAPNPSRAPPAVVPPPSSEQLRHMMDETDSSTCADSSLTIVTPQTPAPPSPVAPPPPEPSLLTCKPLDRVASTQGTSGPSSSTNNSTSSTPNPVPAPTIAIAPPHFHGRHRHMEVSRPGRKEPMERIVSQAPFYLAPTCHPSKLKRARSLSDPPESWRQNATLYAQRQAKYERAAGPRKKMRVLSPQDAAKQVDDERLMHEIRGRARDVSEPVAREPPVNMNSLRMLDTSEVLRHPQMRHDLLFDNFGFRPVQIHDPRYLAQTHYGLLTTHRSQIVNPSLPTEAINRFWDCIRAEVECGCRCTRWGSDGRLKDCICGRWKRDLSEAQWWKESRATWPSRLPKLIQTLREILESLMASTTPCVNHYAHSMTRESMALHNQTCPTVTHSLVPTLFAALDAEFLTIQVRRGNFDTDIFRVIGEAMKVHCAPVRDALVDDMVATALGTNGRLPDVVQALRKCFDCVEVMKLDIANHQVQSLKGMLWQQAEQNEMTTFINYLVAAGRTLETSKTYAWIHAASKRVAVATPPRERRHLMGLCACETPIEFVIRSFADGFVELVFGNWTEASELWPPAVPSRGPGTATCPHVHPTKVVVPEVFKMDSVRLKNFNAEMIDISIAQAILANFKKRYELYNPNATPDEVAAQVLAIRDFYKRVMTHGNGLAQPNEYTGSELAREMAKRIIPPSVIDTSLWELVHDFDRMIAREISRPDDSEYDASISSLRKLVHLMLTNTLLVHRVQPESFLYDMRGLDSKPCTRGEPIPTAPRLRVPARRFVTLVEPLTGQGAATSDPRERHHRPADTVAVIAARELFHTTVAKGHLSETALAVELGFEPLIHEIRAVVDRMVKTADFNLSVFANLYSKKGMLVGTGQLTPLPELSRC